MLASIIIFTFSLSLTLILYKTYFDLKTSVKLKAQAKMAKPIYDYKGRLLSQHFY
jgi:hypothetical protein